MGKEKAPELDEYHRLLYKLRQHSKKSKRSMKMSLAELLRILQLAIEKEENRKQFSCEFVSAWFVALGDVVFSQVTAESMILILERLIRLEINPSDEFPKFYQGWELVVYQKFVESDVLSVLKVYNQDRAIMPKETFDKWTETVLNMLRVSKMKKWSHADFVHLLYGLAVQELQPDNGLVEEWYEQCDARMQGFEPRQLAQYVYVSGKFRVKLSSIRQVELSKTMDIKMAGFKGKDFMLTVYGFSMFPENLEQENFKSFMQDFHRKVKLHCSELDMHSVVKLWYAVAKLEKEHLVSEPNMFHLALSNMSRVVTHQVAGAYAGDVWMLLDALKMQLDNQTLVKIPVGMKMALMASVEHNYKSLWPPALARLPTRMKLLNMSPDEYFVTRLWLPEVKRVLSCLFVDEMLEVLIGLLAHNVDLPSVDDTFMNVWFAQAEKHKAGYFSIKDARSARLHFEKLGEKELPFDFERRLHLAT